MKAPVIIIGAGLAGWTTARELRKLDSDVPITLITADSGDFYAKPSLSNAYAQGRSPAQLVSTEASKMAQTLAVTLLPHTRVSRIDAAARTVGLEGGSALGYSQLVLATGALPIRVPLAGNATQRVLSINSLQDFEAFHAALQAVTPGGGPKPRVLIMGAGLIGCEFANDLASAGYRVSVVDPGASPLAALLPAEASAALQAALEKLGVEFYFETTVASVNAGASAEAAMDVSLANGQTLTAHGVLSAVGLRADTALAQSAGLKTERAILVDRLLQTSAEGIYALGDGVQYASAASGLSAHGAALPYVMPIMNAARALAATLAGTPTAVHFPLMPVSIKTPALPLVAALPQPGSSGLWHAVQDGIWHWLDEAGQPRGFVLAGAQTAQRMAQSKLVVL